MPNYVKNIIKMDGITKLPLFTKNEDEINIFDFNKIIPMPESLRLPSGTVSDYSIMYYLTERCTIPVKFLDEERAKVLSELISNKFSNDWTIKCSLER